MAFAPKGEKKKIIEFKYYSPTYCLTTDSKLQPVLSIAKDVEIFSLRFRTKKENPGNFMVWFHCMSECSLFYRHVESKLNEDTHSHLVDLFFNIFAPNKISFFLYMKTINWKNMELDYKIKTVRDFKNYIKVQTKRLKCSACCCNHQLKAIYLNAYHLFNRRRWSLQAPKTNIN